MGFISHSGAVTIRQEHVTSVFCIFATISLKGFIYPEKANEKPNLLSVRNKAIAEPFRAKKHNAMLFIFSACCRMFVYFKCIIQGN